MALPDLPVPGASGDDAGVTLREMLTEMRKDQERQSALIQEALVRERYVLGEQWNIRDPMSERIIADVGTAADGMIQENHLYPLCNTYSSRVNQGRVDPAAFPVQPTLRDVLASQAADAVLEYERRQCDEDNLIFKAAFLAQCHGDVLFYPTWDEASGPIHVRRQVVDAMGEVYDPLGQPVYEDAEEFGAVDECVVAAPDYWTDVVDEYARCSYLVVRRVVSRAVARARLLAAGLDPNAASVSDQDVPNQNPANLPRRGVECFEVWHRPGARFPQGFFGLVVGEASCKCIPFPYEHNELPGAVWKLGEVRGSPRGKTHVADAIHQQRLLNVVLRAILRRLDVAGQAAMIGSSGHLDALSRAGRRQVPSDLAADRDPRWFIGPEVPQSLFAALADARSALNATFGVNDATSTGGDPAESESGRQLDVAQALDAQKLAPARRALERARLRVAKQKIALWRQFADDARLVRVIGEGGFVSARFLRGADLDGADVALESTQGVFETHVAKEAEAEQEAQAGYIDAGQAAERRKTGLGDTEESADLMSKIDAQCAQALRGMPQQPLPDVPPALGADRTRAWLDAEPKGNVQLLAALYQAYVRVQQTPPPQGGGGQPPPAAPPPRQKGPGTTPAAQQGAQPAPSEQPGKG